MKNLFLFILLFALLGMNEVTGQWNWSGSNIYNTNTGNVGIGNNTPSTLLYVAKNMTEPTITIRNPGGFGGATYSMVDDVSGANWKFKATTSGGFKIRDNAHSMDVFTIEPNSIANALYINAAGNVGIQTTTPSANFHVAETYPGHTAAFGTPISLVDWCTNVSIGDNNDDGILYVGQNDTHMGYLIWRYNADPALAIFYIGTKQGLNPINLQPVAGNVGIHTDAPAATLDVKYDANSFSRLGYNTATCNYFVHYEDAANQDNQSTIDAYQTRFSQNDGSGYSSYATNQAILGKTEFGDIYSFGVSGFNYLDFNRCGGVIGSQSNASCWGSLGYKSSGSVSYGGYFTSYTSGSGKGNQGASIGIGIGAWGDLMGADIHGKIYGIYAEGGNYAMYSHGPVYKDNLDVNLQDNGTGNKTVLYTNVSTDATVQTYGSATLSDGVVSISFDPAFAASVSSREPVVVTVTPIGECNGVHLTNMTNSGITVVENINGRSNVTVNYIAVGKRAGYENPSLPKELIDAKYTDNMTRGLHADADTKTNGEGLYYENGQLVVGIHPSTLPEPNRHVEKPVNTQGNNTTTLNCPVGQMTSKSPW